MQAFGCLCMIFFVRQGGQILSYQEVILDNYRADIIQNDHRTQDIFLVYMFTHVCTQEICTLLKKTWPARGAFPFREKQRGTYHQMVWHKVWRSRNL